MPPIPDIPKQTILDYLAAIGLSPELTEAERTQFVSVCQAFGLNPFKREVYATVYGEGSYRRFSVIVGYETYLKRADRSGKLDGWSSRIEGSGDDMKAIVEIHRRDWSEPLVHEVYFVEAVQKKKDGTPTSFWSKMPRFQLKKVCISQAFRLCFPDELGGLPYTSDELPDAESLASAPATPSTPSPLPVSQPEAAVSEAAPLAEASSARDEPPPQPEASPPGRPFIRSPDDPLPRLPGPVPRRAPERPHRSPDRLPGRQRRSLHRSPQRVDSLEGPSVPRSPRRPQDAGLLGEGRPQCKRCSERITSIQHEVTQ